MGKGKPVRARLCHQPFDVHPAALVLAVHGTERLPLRRGEEGGNVFRLIAFHEVVEGRLDHLPAPRQRLPSAGTGPHTHNRHAQRTRTGVNISTARVG